MTLPLHRRNRCLHKLLNVKRVMALRQLSLMHKANSVTNSRELLPRWPQLSARCLAT